MTSVPCEEMEQQSYEGGSTKYYGVWRIEQQRWIGSDFEGGFEGLYILFLSQYSYFILNIFTA